MVSKFSSSDEGALKELSLFSLPPTNTTVDRYYVQHYQPVTQVGTSTSNCILEFCVNSPRDYTDLVGQVDVSLNGQLISTSNPNYAYKSYIPTLLGCGTDAKRLGYLIAGLFYKDEAGEMDAFDPKSGGNRGLKVRNWYTKKGGSFELEFPLAEDIFTSSNRYMLNSVEIKIRLYPSQAAFCLMSGEAGASYKLRIDEAYLKVPHVRVSIFLIYI